MAEIIDSYSESNRSQNFQLYGARKIGQSFTGDGGILATAEFYLTKYGTVSGNCYVDIYTHSGTYGTDSVPTGTALATSDAVDVDDIPSWSTHELIEFTFSGADKITLTNSTKYVVVIRFSGGDSSNYIYPAYDATSPTHDGNRCSYVSSWSGSSGVDTCFYVYGEDPSTNIVDSYSESNQDSLESLSGTDKVGQSFTGDGKKLGSAEFYCIKGAGATGTIVAKVYAHSGTYGTSSVSTGSALATSDSVDASSISTSLSLQEFTFSGVDKISLTDETKYVVTVEGDFSASFINIGKDESSPTHSGNYSETFLGSWNTFSGTDLIFYVYSSSSDIKSITGVAQADIESVSGTTNANIKSISSVSNQ